jgi:hypothetical protein
MTTPNTLPDTVEYEPTMSQQERVASLRRFNSRFVYAPIIISSVIVVILVLLLLYIALNPPTFGALQTISGISDAVVILFTIPAMIFCSIVPIVFIAATVQARKQGIAPLRQFQILMWRVDGGVGVVRQKTNEIAPKIAAPFIKVRSIYAYIITLLKRLTSIFKRS